MYLVLTFHCNWTQTIDKYLVLFDGQCIQRITLLAHFHSSTMGRHMEHVPVTFSHIPGVLQQPSWMTSAAPTCGDSAIQHVSSADWCMIRRLHIGATYRLTNNIPTYQDDDLEFFMMRNTYDKVAFLLTPPKLHVATLLVESLGRVMFGGWVLPSLLPHCSTACQ